jgi:transposase
MVSKRTSGSAIDNQKKDYNARKRTLQKKGNGHPCRRVTKPTSMQEPFPMTSIRITFTNTTQQQLQKGLDRAYRHGDRRLVKRITALLSLAYQHSVAQAAAIASVTRKSVYTWLHAFVARGLASLQYPKAPGRPPRLTKTQKRELIAAVRAGPEAAGYGTACWTARLVQQWIEREFGILYNQHYVCELLHNLGFSYQKAAYAADHLDPEARTTWLAMTWPEILRVAREKEAWIVFGDEVSFAQWGSLGYTWAPRGVQPVVKTAGKRKGYKVFGGIEFFSGQLITYTLTTGRFNSATYQEFLTHLLAQTECPIILIQDGARYHTSRSTRDFFAAHADRLIVYQLPSYSPDYNPIEFLWKQMKQRATHNKYFPTFDKLLSVVDEAVAHFAQHKAYVKKLFGLYLQSLDLAPITQAV